MTVKLLTKEKLLKLKKMFLDNSFGNYTLNAIENAMDKVQKALGVRESKLDGSNRKKMSLHIFRKIMTFHSTDSSY